MSVIPEPQSSIVVNQQQLTQASNQLQSQQIVSQVVDLHQQQANTKPSVIYQTNDQVSQQIAYGSQMIVDNLQQQQLIESGNYLPQNHVFLNDPQNVIYSQQLSTVHQLQQQQSIQQQQQQSAAASTIAADSSSSHIMNSINDLSVG